jgi:cysteinyl-tRNA synthetase
VRLYNTLTRSTEPFRPQDGVTVGMYVCGPTVYDHLHIGNVRPILVFDALRRYFERFKGWDVVYVQNVTDVDDKLIVRSQETGRPADEIAAEYTDAYFALLDALGAASPTHSPRATEHIDEMIALIVALVRKDFAYERHGDVYFRVGALPDYGKLSGRTLEDQEVGARIAASQKKENPLDFTLWKAAKPGEPKWPSPWGEGRPGWHTECVVLSRRYLGDRLDIHAGGNDLVFPHHENEIAQAEAATSKPFFRFWLHNGMLHLGGQEMHKSLGNFRYAYEILDEFDRESVRYFYLSHHYRKPLEYTTAALEGARAAVTRVRTLIDDTTAELQDATGEPGEQGLAFLDSLRPFRDRYVEAMDDDFNTAGAVGAIQELVNATNRFREIARGNDRLAMNGAVDLLRTLGEPIGLFQEPDVPASRSEPGLIDLLIDLREELRSKEDFDLADRIRDRLSALGIVLKDTAQGTIWTKTH